MCLIAGCYKSDKLIVPLWSLNQTNELHGAQIAGYIYSEAGSGKSSCDQVRFFQSIHVIIVQQSDQKGYFAHENWTL